ncbi:hypothetical protein EGT50_04220 [Rhodococcus xishaensis]|uniref:Uncharacterized protein n=1 Tax=Rhodococcus xishaensis TaxID=2487364 RepID=A0A3S3ZQ68_9NOCA|nr:hypothetical protein EGT50_04220 [Rhodococcus xishaensis]
MTRRAAPAESSQARAMLGVDHDALSRLTLSAARGSDGLVIVPYLDLRPTRYLSSGTALRRRP